MSAENEEPKPRRILRRLFKIAAILALLLALAGLFWFRGALHNHHARFPAEAKAWAALRAQRQPVPRDLGWTEFRGILHSHSELSHDSEVPFQEIHRAMKAAGAHFICLSDHCDQGRADFSRQWRGVRDGKLFIPGFEMKEGLMPFGVASDVVLSNSMDGGEIARLAVTNGGVLFYAHPEEPRDWGRPELTGMEIFNIHAAFKEVGLLSLVPDLILNQDRYPDHVFRLIFRRPDKNLQRWDQLNRGRHITGIAGNDCHQNTGLRATVTETNTVVIDNTGKRLVKLFRLHWFNRALFRLCFGKLEPKRVLFHLQLDPYERMSRFVGTHVLARDFSEASILEALRAGRAFIGFDMIADSSTFRWFAQGEAGALAAMGEAFPYSKETRLVALSPIPCRFTVLKDGEVVHRAQGRSLEWTPPGPGKYRVEAELNMAATAPPVSGARENDSGNPAQGDWVPWVYANPIELFTSAPAR